MQTLKLSWEDIEMLIQDIVGKINNSNFIPDYLLGITTGGLIPLYFLSKELGNNNIVTISASSYEKDTQGELLIKYLPEINLKDKKVLLVDDISETGQTLKKIAEIVIEKYSVSELKIASIGINSEKCQFRPDYFGIESDKWLVFPWEKKDFPEYFK
jgi:hypoxanthine phosphoribosyltransferase